MSENTVRVVIDIPEKDFERMKNESVYIDVFGTLRWIDSTAALLNDGYAVRVQRIT